MAETDNITLKCCTLCGESKPLELFGNDKNRKDGKFPQCKPCKKLGDQRTYAKYHERRKEENRDNYRRNKDAYMLRAKKWATENPEKRLEVARNYVRQNPEKRKDTVTRYTKQNLAYYAAAYKARQQRKRQAMPSWANGESIKAIYRQAAWVQKVTGVKQHVDHFYPLKNDLVCGLHNEFNLRIIPAFDNLSKGNKLPE